MKIKFSTKWVGSAQRRKQRKYRRNSPLHLKRRFLAANLSKDLRTKHGVRSLPLRSGDKVKVLRGKYSGQEGKVDHFHLGKVLIDKIKLSKGEGSETQVPISPSNLQITSFGSDDKLRFPVKEGGKK